MHTSDAAEHLFEKDKSVPYQSVVDRRLPLLFRKKFCCGLVLLYGHRTHWVAANILIIYRNEEHWPIVIRVLYTQAPIKLGLH